MLNEGIMSRSRAWWYYVDSCCRSNSLCCGRRRATALAWNKLYPVASVPAPWCALQAGHVRGQPALLSMRWLCGAKAGRRIRSAKVFFQSSYGKCDSLVSQSAACQHGGGRRKTPREGWSLWLANCSAAATGSGGKTPSATIWHDSAVRAQSVLLSSTLAEGAGSVPTGLLSSARDRSRGAVVVK